jgi:hypothetical protein
MKLLSKKEFDELSDWSQEGSVSIYLPTHRSGEAVNNGKDALRLKNLLQTAKSKLSEQGFTDAEIQELLAPARKLQEDHNFWHHQLEGLALFIGKGFFKSLRLPTKFEESVSISPSFHLLQLIPLLNGDGIYYILGLSMERVRLLEATHYYVHELDLNQRVQQGLEEVLKYYEFERSEEGQSGLVPNPQNRNGQGEPKPSKKDLIDEYFRNVNEGLKNIIVNNRTPIVLAGVEYLHPIFKQAASQFNICEEGITGNPDQMTASDLHAKSWEIVKPHFSQKMEQTIENYNNLAGTGKTTYNLEDIVAAAENGRVDSLFVVKGNHQWGKFHKDRQAVELHSDPKQGDECMISRSAVATLKNGGQAYVLEESEMPKDLADNHVAAILRF